MTKTVYKWIVYKEGKLLIAESKEELEVFLSKDKEYINLLLQNEKLKNEIRSFEKHKLILEMPVNSDEFGSTRFNRIVENGMLKRLKEYRIILEEI